LQAHGFPPSFAGLAYFMASFSSRTAKIVGGPTDFGKSGLVGRKPTIRYMKSGSEFARRPFRTPRAARLISAHFGERPPRRLCIPGGAAGMATQRLAETPPKPPQKAAQALTNSKQFEILSVFREK
jgi:hypothetical protein